MTTRIGKKRINSEILMYKSSNFIFPNLILKPDLDNILIWYFVVYDLKDTPYQNGFYFGKILLPEEYPFKAPDFIFLTPNGRFEVNKKICTSFSAYHPESYTTAWNILTMMEGLISFMTDEVDESNNSSIGSIFTPITVRKTLAINSMSWNKTNKDFMSVFGEYNFDLT